jgi:prepilin signal peptidase PulO-like enzyme (type II secretory pathway)
MPPALPASAAALATVAAAATGLAGAYLIALIGLFCPLANFVIAPLYGRLVADAVLAFSNNTGSRALEAVGVGSICLGVGLAFTGPLGSERLFHTSMPDVAQAMIGLSVGIAVVICYSRLHRAAR